MIPILPGYIITGYFQMKFMCFLDFREMQKFDAAKRRWAKFDDDK